MRKGQGEATRKIKKGKKDGINTKERKNHQGYGTKRRR